MSRNWRVLRLPRCVKGHRFMYALGCLCLAIGLGFMNGCSLFIPPGKTDTPEGRDGRKEKLVLATTTSTYDSGILDKLLPAFTEKHGIEVHVLSQGTGQSLETGKRGDADVLLVHDRPSELDLVKQGYFVNRQDIMYNDYILVGPFDDPAGVKQFEKAVEAFSVIASVEHPFVSRGDDSGTHRTERIIWNESGIADFGDWHLSVGQGMGQTLTIAYEKQAYTLSDRATFTILRDSFDLQVLLEEDPLFLNQYGIMAVNPEKHPHVNYSGASKLIDFMMSPEGREIISSFQVEGESLFFPGWSEETKN